MQPSPKVLAVDDDPTACVFIFQILSALGAEVAVAQSCQEFLETSKNYSADLYLIDVELPDGSGYDLARSVSASAHQPIVFFSVRNDTSSRIKALELGAVEFLTKPLHPREFFLRIENILVSLGHRLRSTTRPVGESQREPTESFRSFGGWTLDLRRRCLIDQRGTQCALTAAEFEVLDLLTAEPHRTVSRDEMARQLGEHSAARHNARIVDGLIWRIRKKLGHDTCERPFIATVPSQGYRFTSSVAVR